MRALWKQDTPLHPGFGAINRCLREDWFLLPYEVALQRAHARTLEQARILTGAEVGAIEDALQRIAREHSTAECPNSDEEDIHSWMEARLTDLAGEAGRKIHTARSRNDQVATLLKLYVIEAGQALAGRVRELARLACGRAGDWSELEFPLHTHTQFAAPGTVGFWALRYATAFQRCARRLDSAAAEWRRFCPLGSGAVAGSSIPIDRRIQARELGFQEPSPNALDSTSTRDECLELLAVAAQIALHLQSLATDVITFSQTSLGWTKYPAEFATGSSMMPNKVNPDAMELLRGECALIAGAQGQAVMLLKGLPSGYNRDLQCLKPLLRQTVEVLAAMLDMARDFLARLDFDAERLSSSVNAGHIGATLRMESKVKAGMTLREAHHAVADEVKRGARTADASEGLNASSYATIGSASPAETRRVAEALLKELS